MSELSSTALWPPPVLSVRTEQPASVIEAAAAPVVDDGPSLPLLLVTCLAHVLLAGILWLTMWATVPRLFGWHPTVITGGSMLPNIAPGDIVVSRDAANTDVLPGAVITFTDPSTPGHLITHRVAARLDDGAIRTQGDANQSPDARVISIDDVRGRAVLRIPAIGLPLLWMEQNRWPLVAASLFTLALLTWIVLRIPLPRP